MDGEYGERYAEDEKIGINVIIKNYLDIARRIVDE